VFCAQTASSVAAFQRARGLPDDGVCDDDTWTALIEAGWALGDRVLYHRSPNLRGDDVSELQQRLGRLGFDAGRVDGIFGPLTAAALEELQRNLGLPPDGVCGAETVRALRRLGPRTDHGPAVASVREEERLRVTGELAGTRIVIGHYGGLGMLTRTVGRMLRGNGARVLAADEFDQRAHAVVANQFDAAVYVGVQAAESPGAIAYYATDGFESIGGRRLAHRLFSAFGDAGVASLCCSVVGMRMPVLRETRMPAVLCQLGPTDRVVDQTPSVAVAIMQALSAWRTQPSS
jgi:N-acetylmuramoyl-L-alanine amidase